MVKKSFSLLFLFNVVLVGVCLQAQQFNPSLEFFSNQQFNFIVNQTEQAIHSTFKPFLIPKGEYHANNDSLDSKKERDKFLTSTFKSRWLYRKVRTEDFINLKTENFRLQVNPLFNFELKQIKNGDDKLFTNTRGIELKGDIDGKLFFYSSFYENQARFEPFISDYINKTLVVPGQGAPKFLENNKLDYSFASGYLYFNVKKFLNIQLGQSKHFIGEGYRSLLLSDNAFNYPFLKVTSIFGQFQYILLWSEHQLFKSVYYNYHFRKYNAISYLSWVPKNGFELAIFESIEWPGNTSEHKNFSFNFFNPIIFWRTIQFGLDSEKNTLLGLTTKIKLYDFAQIYGQFALDKLGDSNSNKNYAFQVGVKHFNLFHNRLGDNNLFVQLEYNYVSPYTYSHSNAFQSFTHYNQPIAHPAGTGLTESLGILKYSYKDLSIRMIASYIINSIDTLNTNFGSDVFKMNDEIPGIISHTGGKPGQGVKNEIFKINSEILFLINPSTNMQIFAQLVYRRINNIFDQKKELFFSIGIRTNLTNYYYDF